MNEQFVRDRITQLRLEKNVSEYKMSYDLGHSRSYINNISSGKALPSMSEFFAICEYFNITPVDFFNTAMRGESVLLMKSLTAQLAQLTPEDLSLLLALADRLQKET